MNSSKLNKSIASLAVVCALSACGDNGSDGQDGANGTSGINSLINQTELAVGGEACFNGGLQIDSGLDSNVNNQLDSDEITSSELICTPAMASNIANLGSGQNQFVIETSSAALASVDFSLGETAGNSINLTLGFGSGAYHAASDPANRFYSISDRGPNIKCSDAEAILAISDFCQINGQPASGKIFPVADFSPTIYQWELVENSLGERRAQLVKKITLKDSDGNPVSGLPNPLIFADETTNTENAFAADGTPIPFDPQGLDPEALVKLSDGSFWVAEEYGASILHVAGDGKILNRHVPAGIESQLSEANYPVMGSLPAVYHKRKLNRGIESIAVSPNEDYLYFIMQSPLNNPDYKKSRNVRVMKFALSAGELGAPLGEYVYQMDMPETFTDGIGGDLGKVQNDVKISEMLAVAEDDLIVLERISKTTKLYRINLNTGDNILHSTLSEQGAMAMESDSNKPLEELYNLAAVNAEPVAKALAFNSLVDAPNLAKKIEGIAWLNPKQVMLINDNDFGIAGVQTEIQVLNIGEGFTQSSTAIFAKPEMSLVGRFQASSDGEGAAEIVQYHARSNSVFTINGDLGNRVEVISLADLNGNAMAEPLISTNLSGINYDLPNEVMVDENLVSVADINSIAIHGDKLAVAIAHENDISERGVVLFYQISNNGSIDVDAYTAARVGVLPDNVAFSPDGKKIVVADEGQAGDEPMDDALGSISIIEVNDGVMANSATTLTFEAFNDFTAEGININPDVIDLAHAIEPEYVSVSADSSKAYVTLQEMNALAIVDLFENKIVAVKSLGLKDYSKASNALDVSDKDDAVNIVSYDNVVGLYQPDTIVSYQVDGKTYLLTANEGDAGDGFHDVDERVEDLALDATAFPNASELQTDAALGRLKVVPYLGQNENGEFEKLYAFGGRSFSIWDENGKQVFDSGSDFEKITAGLYGLNFNNDEDDNDADTRSDAKGPEPEALAVGQVGERTYAFIGMERMGGIAMYDITDPYGVQFVSYTNNRDFNNIDNGDLAPEGMTFVSADKSPTGEALLIVGNEISGTVAVYQVK